MNAATQSLGLRTNPFLHSLQGSVTSADGYRIVRTPDNPDYWFGNSLIMPGPPGDGDLPRWEALHLAAHPEAPHRVFQCDGTEGELGSSRAFLAAGDQTHQMEVLTTRGLTDNGKLTVRCQFRDLSTDSDWEQALAMRHRIAVEEEGYTAGPHLEYCRAQFAFQRSIVDNGQARWHGAFDGDRLVGALGLVGQGEFGRFQQVDTHPEQRRRGVCSSLVSHAAREALLEHPARPLVMIAFDDYHARHIYRSLGFTTTERIVSFVRAKV